jgi:hypothetical protein
MARRSTTTTAKKKPTTAASNSRMSHVQVSIPSHFAKKAKDLLERSGSSLETYLQMQTIAFTRANSLIGLNDTIHFGKYSGLRCEDVVRTDRAYITWLMGVSQKAKFDADVIELVHELEAEFEEYGGDPGEGERLWV